MEDPGYDGLSLQRNQRICMKLLPGVCQGTIHYFSGMIQITIRKQIVFKDLCLRPVNNTLIFGDDLFYDPDPHPDRIHKHCSGDLQSLIDRLVYTEIKHYLHFFLTEHNSSENRNCMDCKQ